MKKVKLLVNTAYQGPRKEGDVIPVPDDFAHRWVNNGIAEYYNGNDAVNEGDTLPEQEVDVKSEEQETAENGLSKMSAKDLYALCKEKGLDVEAKKGKEYYIEKLNS